MRGWIPSHPEPLLRLAGTYRSAPASEKGFLLSSESKNRNQIQGRLGFSSYVVQRATFFLKRKYRYCEMLL